jgi:hypothetical protein
MNTLRVSNIIVLGFSASEPKPVAFRGSASLATSQYAYQVTNDRELRHLKLKGSGIPVPEARSFKARDLKAVAAGARELGFPLLAKPLAKHGREQWDSAARDEDELLESVAGLSREVLTRGKPRTHGRVLLERFAGTTGSSVLVVDGEVAGAVSRGARPEASIGAIGFTPTSWISAGEPSAGSPAPVMPK